MALVVAGVLLVLGASCWAVGVWWRTMRRFLAGRHRPGEAPLQLRRSLLLPGVIGAIGAGLTIAGAITLAAGQ